jgi:hypothetical protein
MVIRLLQTSATMSHSTSSLRSGLGGKGIHPCYQPYTLLESPLIGTPCYMAA